MKQELPSFQRMSERTAANQTNGTQSIRGRNKYLWPARSLCPATYHAAVPRMISDPSTTPNALVVGAGVGRTPEASIVAIPAAEISHGKDVICEWIASWRVVCLFSLSMTPMKMPWTCQLVQWNVAQTVE